MTSNRLDTGLLARVLLLLAALAGSNYAALHQAYGWALLALGLLLALAISLTRYLTRGQRALADFVLALKYRDFSRHYLPGSAAASGPALHAALNQVSATFRELRAEKEAQFQYLQTILALLDTGIVSYNATGKVAWANDTFRQTLHLPVLQTMQALEKRHPAFYAAIGRVVPGQPAVVQLTVGAQVLQLLLSATRFQVRGEAFTLLAFKNVSQTLADTETEAWQKLLRVMTHEIMNSVAPIASLANSLHHHMQLTQQAGPAAASAELLDDVRTGLHIIQQRGEGLLRFAKVYRDFSTLAPPQRTRLAVQELLQATGRLLAKQVAEQGIRLAITVQPSHLLIFADGQLLQQVLLNLVLNAAQAVAEVPSPRIDLRAFAEESGQVIITVQDNGCGIPTDLFDSIFIPFFTTRPSGSGIGLSLAKQIMQLHQGSIQVRSAAGEGSVFQLWFPAAALPQAGSTQA